MVSSSSSSASPTAATTSSVWAGDSRTSSANGLRHGTAPSAPVQLGRSSVGSRWTVPRGPCTRIRLRSSQSARCTSLRVAPVTRRATECSAEACTWACAPAIADAAAAAVGWALVRGEAMAAEATHVGRLPGHHRLPRC